MEIRINGLTKIFPPNIQALSDIYLNLPALVSVLFQIWKMAREQLS